MKCTFCNTPLIWKQSGHEKYLGCPNFPNCAAPILSNQEHPPYHLFSTPVRKLDFSLST